MANTYTQCHFHLVFAVKNREALIMPEWKDDLEKYIITHSHSSIDHVVKYILNQEGHHRKKSFKDEYLEMLLKNDIKFNDDYLFDFLDNVDLE